VNRYTTKLKVTVTTDDASVALAWQKLYELESFLEDEIGGKVKVFLTTHRDRSEDDTRKATG
jgi:hypothetical protein